MSFAARGLSISQYRTVDPIEEVLDERLSKLLIHEDLVGPLVTTKTIVEVEPSLKKLALLRCPLDRTEE